MNTTEMHIPSNKVREIRRYLLTELSGLYPAGELRVFAAMLFESIMGWNAAKVIIHDNDTINQSDLLKFHWAVEDLKKYRPIQHITGFTEFCNCRIDVTPDTLIPRPETEAMVSMAASLTSYYHISGFGCRILDLCCGSGCIAIAMQYLHDGSVAYGVDISEAALSVARNNARQNNQRTQFIQCDLLRDEPQLPLDQFDVIISNPPYVREIERAAMQPNVLDYEPALALFVPDDDPLLFYRVLAQYAAKHLAPKGFLLFEINENLGPETLSLVKSLGFNAQLLKDFRDKDRYILGRRKGHALRPANNNSW